MLRMVYGSPRLVMFIFLLVIRHYANPDCFTRFQLQHTACHILVVSCLGLSLGANQRFGWIFLATATPNQ